MVEVAVLMSQADEVAESLAAYLGALPAQSWTAPSDCAGWSVAAAVAHLVLVQDLLGDSVERGLRGDSGPPPEAADGVPAWRAWRAREVERLSALPPEELLRRYQDGLVALRASFARLGDPAAAQERGWHPAGAQPLPWFPGQWLTEIVLHDWDIRVAADAAAELHPAALASMGPEMRARLERCYRPATGAGLRGVLRIVLDGPAPTAWLTRLDGETCEVLDDGALPVDATIETDPGAYALIQTARRPAATFAAVGRWRISGNGVLAEGLAGAFRGY